MNKTQIKVFVTKTHKFRAKIEEPGEPPYEVTINGDMWKQGKGRTHRRRILDRIGFLMEMLEHEQHICATETT
jgi:hypothetical protein